MVAEYFPAQNNELNHRLLKVVNIWDFDGCIAPSFVPNAPFPTTVATFFPVLRTENDWMVTGRHFSEKAQVAQLSGISENRIICRDFEITENYMKKYVAWKATKVMELVLEFLGLAQSICIYDDDTQVLELERTIIPYCKRVSLFRATYS